MLPFFFFFRIIYSRISFLTRDFFLPLLPLYLLTDPLTTSTTISQFTQSPDFSHLHICLGIHGQYSNYVLTNSFKSPMPLTFDLSTLPVSSFGPTYVFFYSLNKDSLSTYHGPDTFLYAEETSVRNKISLLGLMF